jgi:peroxiredoxin
MSEATHPLQPGDRVPAFALPAINREGSVSLQDLNGRPFLIGFFRGLHCPFCRRQVVQLAGVQPALRDAGVETLAVINTPLERARIYFRHRPTPLTLLSDPQCRTHRAFGLPRIAFIPEGGGERPEWPHRATMDQFLAARINPTGELPQPTQPMQANDVLNAMDRFELDATDKAIYADYGTQLAGHFLVDGAGIVRWAHIEARGGPENLCNFPRPAQILAAARSLST